jgi:hypothetical protein
VAFDVRTLWSTAAGNTAAGPTRPFTGLEAGAAGAGTAASPEIINFPAKAGTDATSAKTHNKRLKIMTLSI